MSLLHIKLLLQLTLSKTKGTLVRSIILIITFKQRQLL